MIEYRPCEFAKLVGVTVQTLQNWDKKGQLRAFWTPGNRRYYTDEHLAKFNEGKPCNLIEKNKLL